MRMKPEAVVACAAGLATIILSGGGQRPVRAAQLAKDRDVTSAVVDLNGDGKAERVSLTDRKEDGRFVLRIGTQSINGRTQTQEYAASLLVLDIDASDKCKEIAVYSSAPSDWDEYLIYWYDGKTIREVGALSPSADFTGKGIVYGGTSMGFWWRKDRYRLNAKTHRLEETPQELYYVGVSAPVQSSFPLCAVRTAVGKKDAAVIANLRAKSTAHILCYHPTDKCYLVKSESGIMGWAKESTLSENMELSNFG